jgi:hypothetical protein
MIEDAPAKALLDEVVANWTDGRVLPVVCELVPTVWRRNLDRYEPARLGDDAMSLGIQSSRNLCNLAVRGLEDVPDVRALDKKTLEVTYQGRVLHVGKVGSRLETWDVSSVDWSDSEVRSTCAEANTDAYLPVAGTLFESVGALPGQPADPRALRHLQLMWQGFDDGGTRTWLGFPRLGTEAWFAVVLMDDNRGNQGGRPIDGDTSVAPLPDFDAMGEPELGLARRTEREARQQPRGV